MGAYSFSVIMNCNLEYVANFAIRHVQITFVLDFQRGRQVVRGGELERNFMLCGCSLVLKLGNVSLSFYNFGFPGVPSPFSIFKDLPHFLLVADQL